MDFFSIVLGGGLLLTVLWVLGLHGLFEITTLSRQAYLLVAGLSLMPLVVIQLMKRVKALVELVRV